VKPNALLIDPTDNVVTLLRRVPAGGTVVWIADGGSVVARQELPAGHKAAIKAIAPRSDIRKYGYPIGTAGEAIAPGDWVHTHNLEAVGE
jgi:altronate hydrolase